MRPPRGPLFLQRPSYRRRRLIDTMRILPVLGAFGFMMPLLWPEHSATARAFLFVFAVWAALIVLALVLGRRLQRAEHWQDGPSRRPAER